MTQQRLLRLSQIIGDKEAKPPIPALIPISKATWYRGISEGRYPKGFRIGTRCVAWRATDIDELIAHLGLGDGHVCS